MGEARGSLHEPGLPRGPACPLLCLAIPLQHLPVMLGTNAITKVFGPADIELFLPLGGNAEQDIAPVLYLISARLLPRITHALTVTYCQLLWGH